MANYYSLKVKEVIKETEDAISIHFKQPLFKKIKYKSGQFITLILTIDGEEVRRSYSLSSTPQLDSYLSVAVKRVENGKVSNYLNDDLKSGTSIRIMEPMGNFIFEPDKNLSRSLVFFAGGSGITPVLSMIKSALFFEPQSKVYLAYCNRNSNSIIYHKRIQELQEKFGDRFFVKHFLSQENNGSVSGRISEDAIQKVIEDTQPVNNKATYYVCGPEGMMEKVIRELENNNIPENQIKTESFFQSLDTTENETIGVSGDKKVKILLDGNEHEIVVSSGKSILDAALDEGLNMPFSCQSGLCTACRAKKITGEIKMSGGDGLSDEEIKEGYVLTCVGHPLTDDVSIELE